MGRVKEAMEMKRLRLLAVFSSVLIAGRGSFSVGQTLYSQAYGYKTERVPFTMKMDQTTYLNTGATETRHETLFMRPDGSMSAIHDTAIPGALPVREIIDTKIGTHTVFDPATKMKYTRAITEGAIALLKKVGRRCEDHYSVSGVACTPNAEVILGFDTHRVEYTLTDSTGRQRRTILNAVPGLDWYPVRRQVYTDGRLEFVEQATHVIPGPPAEDAFVITPDYAEQSLLSSFMDEGDKVRGLNPSKYNKRWDPGVKVEDPPCDPGKPNCKR